MTKDLVFTIDVEEWFHAENISTYVYDTAHSSMGLLYTLLEILERKNARGTFFWLSDVAVKNKRLLEDVVNAGHEIASHGIDHALLTSLSETETRRQLQKSKAILEDMSGTEILGFRSPCFSTNKYLSTELSLCGYKYTSNGMHVTGHDRYGGRVKQNATALPDFELPTIKIGRVSIPVTGGGYFRLFPAQFQKRLINYSAVKPIIFYCHPWDFDVKQPVLNGLPFVKKFRHYVGIKSALQKVEKFNFSNKTLSDFL
jgi:polysaccharide deacetylase family protein (PEP-CTERM system associated)